MGNPKQHYALVTRTGLRAMCKAPTDRITTAFSNITCLTCRKMYHKMR